jgi:hypothetical protein
MEVRRVKDKAQQDRTTNGKLAATMILLSSPLEML